MGLLQKIGRHALTQDIVKNHFAACVRNRSILATCNRCRDVCAVKALSYSGGVWQVSDNCLQCGFCVAACPLQVFYFETADPVEREPQQVILTCRQDQAGETLGNKMPCFQSLRAEDIALWLDHCERLVLFANCEACTNQWFPEGITNRLDQLHVPWQGRLHIIREKKDLAPYLPPEIGRRDFIIQSVRDARRTGRVQLASFFDNIIEDLSFSGKDDELRELFFEPDPQKMARYYQAHPDIPGEKELPYPQLKNRGCHFCGACTRLCPTKALSIEEKEGVRILQIDPKRCVRCDLCRDVCINAGFQWGEPLKVGDLRDDRLQVLAQSLEKHCVSCGSSYYDTANGDHCFFCAQK